MKNKKNIIIVVILVAGLLASFVTYNYAASRQVDLNEPSTARADLSGPTKTDKQDVDNNKTTLPPANTPATSVDKMISVEPTIVDVGFYDGNVEVRAYIAGVIESTGTCTYLFSSGSQSISKSVPSEVDAQHTRCQNLVTSGSEFKSGNWNLQVSYLSVDAKGTSPVKTFVVNK